MLGINGGDYATNPITVSSGRVLPQVSADKSSNMRIPNSPSRLMVGGDGRRTPRRSSVNALG